MEAFLEREEAITTSQLVGILPGDPPMVNLVDYASGRNGAKRHIARQVPVPNGDLFARLQREVNVGDYIRASIVNEYRETGSLVYLANFQNVSEAAVNAVVPGTNGSLTYDEITEVTAHSGRGTKSRVRH